MEATFTPAEPKILAKLCEKNKPKTFDQLSQVSVEHIQKVGFVSAILQSSAYFSELTIRLEYEITTSCYTYFYKDTHTQKPSSYNQTNTAIIQCQNLWRFSYGNYKEKYTVSAP